MERVDFIEKNEFHIKSRRILGDPTTPTMVNILIKIGFAKDEKQALIILLTVVAIMIFFTSFLIYSRTVTPSSDFVIDQFGNSYTFEQYIDLVRQGEDPLLPK